MRKLATLLTLVSISVTALATEFDLANNFSTSNNPSATWTYGWFGKTIPNGSSLFLLAWNGNGWSTANGDEVWRNETGSAIGNVAPGQVALNTLFDEPAVVRWTAPAEIGLAVIQIDGELATGITGLEIRRGAGIVLSVTNTSTFNVEMMVEPGDTIDFVGIGTGTKPLDLTITTLKEHLTLTTLDDFDRYFAISAWTRVPLLGSFDDRSEGSPITNYWMIADDTYGWGKAMYRAIPVEITTNTDLISFRHFSKIGVGGSGSYGVSGLRLCDSSITTTNSTVVEWAQYSNQATGQAYIYFRDGNGTSHHGSDGWNYDEKLEFRADIDWSYVDGEGKYGLFTLFMKREGTIQWSAVRDLVNIEMKVSAPTAVTHLCGITNHRPFWGYMPFLDDIRYCTGENYNLGTNTNLLIGPHFSYSTTAWRTDGEGQSKFDDDSPHDGIYVSTGSTSPVQVHQEVNLLNQGLTAEDIDSGMYNVEFGGWQISGNGSARIELEFLDINNQLISSNSLPAPARLFAWTEFISTNPIPAQTRSIRYNSYLAYGAKLDDAHLSVLGIPQEDKALTISSALGAPVPTTGTHSNSWGTIVNCSVAHVNAGTTQYECIGWSGTGSVPATGTSNAVEITLTEDSSISWNWQTNYWLDVTINGGGALSHADGFYLASSDQTVIATPASGYLFMNWGGDASGTNLSTSITMSSTRSITATFSDDADDDELTNDEEASLGTNPRKTDTDDDGFGDKLEVDHNWNPQVSDKWAVDHIQANGEIFGLYPSNAVLDVSIGQMLLEVDDTTISLQLQLEKSEDLNSWTNAGEKVEWILNVDAQKQFYRVRSAK
jgi:hypothetical protein